MDSQKFKTPAGLARDCSNSFEARVASAATLMAPAAPFSTPKSKARSVKTQPQSQSLGFNSAVTPAYAKPLSRIVQFAGTECIIIPPPTSVKMKPINLKSQTLPDDILLRRSMIKPQINTSQRMKIVFSDKLDAGEDIENNMPFRIDLRGNSVLLRLDEAKFDQLCQQSYKFYPKYGQMEREINDRLYSAEPRIQKNLWTPLRHPARRNAFSSASKAATFLTYKDTENEEVFVPSWEAAADKQLAITQSRISETVQEDDDAAKTEIIGSSSVFKPEELAVPEFISLQKRQHQQQSNLVERMFETRRNNAILIKSYSLQQSIPQALVSRARLRLDTIKPGSPWDLDELFGESRPATPRKSVEAAVDVVDSIGHRGRMRAQNEVEDELASSILYQKMVEKGLDLDIQVLLQEVALRVHRIKASRVIHDSLANGILQCLSDSDASCEDSPIMGPVERVALIDRVRAISHKFRTTSDAIHRMGFDGHN